MLKVDLSNVWGDLSLPDLLATEQEVFAAHKTLAEGRGPGNDCLLYTSPSPRDTR